MSQLQVADYNVAADSEGVSSTYVPPLQRTEGQPPPVAANGGLSYMSVDWNGDAGTTVALEHARAEIVITIAAGLHTAHHEFVLLIVENRKRKFGMLGQNPVELGIDFGAVVGARILFAHGGN